MDWHTDDLPMNGVELEIVTVDGKALSGQILYAGKYHGEDGRKHYRYVLAGNVGAMFEISRWRRVAVE